jgi:BolA family transcriptional regulator, general stress-responsive regulator
MQTTGSTRVGEQIRARLDAAELIDQSDQHAGHGGSRPEGETHFHVTVVADAFADRSRVARQRLVMTALADLLTGRVHALSIHAATPAEWAAARR